MKKYSTSLIIFFSIAFILFFTVGGYIINKTHHENVKQQPQMYCYQTYFGPPNSVLIIESLKYRNDYINYYEKVSDGENPSFNFPLKSLPLYSPVYVLGYTNDSLLVDVVSYYDRGARKGGSYTRGWVYAETIHINPPKKLK